MLRLQTPINLWPHQEKPVAEAVEAHQWGIDLVIIDAPTGSGKTIMGEEVRRRLGTSGMYCCTTKGLQDQFMGTFPEAMLLKGRSNYQTQWGGIGVTCDDCMGNECEYCDPNECPYKVAKQKAIVGPLSVVNTSYLLAESNYVGGFKGLQYVTVDEADELERSLTSFVEFRVGNCKPLRAPRKGSHKETIGHWVGGDYLEHATRQLKAAERKKDVNAIKLWGGRVGGARRMALELEKYPDNWIRDNKAEGDNGLVMKPVTVGELGRRYLWQHGKKWTLMSGTVVDPGALVEAIGWEKDWHVVKVPMTFPVENRPIILAPVADVTYSKMDEAIGPLAKAIDRIIDRHPGERVLVHTVSYQLAARIRERLTTTRPVFTYEPGAGERGRDQVFENYSMEIGAVLLAPSMDRGYDFVGDLARVVVVAKCPFPALDTVTSARLHLPGGDNWYRVTTVRTIMQMTGRGVRNASDTATTYILDRQFISNVWKNGKRLFPDWWVDALDWGFPVRELL